MEPWVWIAVTAALVLAGVHLWSLKRQRKPTLVDVSVEKLDPVDEKYDPHGNDPQKLRPFKAPYHMTMGLMKSSIYDWIRVEKGYVETARYRKKIAETMLDDTCLVMDQPKTKEAVLEAYETVKQFLCERYPRYFIRSGDAVQNTLTGEEIPSAKGRTPKELVQLISSNVLEDMVLLEFDENEDEYRLRMSTGVGANGFVATPIMGLKMSEIHKPVPMFKEKLQLSMTKLFKNVQAGKWVQRVTWGVQYKGELFQPGENHYHEGDGEIVPLVYDNVDWDQMRIRVEHQMLTRLPQSQFLIFTVRTTFFPLADIKAEGYGPKMKETIDSYPPPTAKYKGVMRWYEAVSKYLST